MLFLSSAAASSAIDLISSLKQTIDSGKSKSGVSSSPFDWSDASSASTSATTAAAGSATTSSNTVSPATMRAMLWLQGQGVDVSSKIFSALDADGSGGISKSEFEQMFAANGNTTRADAAFAKLDTDGDGAVSSQELASGLKAQHHHGHAKSGGSDGTNASQQNDNAATVANADGSSTTTITYSDGSKVTLTRPASEGTSAVSANLLERLIQRQADMLTPITSGQTLAVST
jgi:hypothetical protein